MTETRPEIPEPSPDEQAEHLRATGNGPTAAWEERLLREEFGAPDEHGIYAAPTTPEGSDA